MNAHVDWVNQDGGREAQRALDVSGAGGVLVQPLISRIVQLLTLRHLGVTSTLPRRPGSGPGFYSNRRSAANTQSAWVADTEEPVESEGTYTQVTFNYKTLLGRIKVTRQLIAKGRSYGDVLATELMGKAEDFRNTLESASVIGDSAANTKQIDGLLTLIGNVSGQTIANTTATAGDAIYLSKLDATIHAVKGSDNKPAMRIYASLAGQRRLNSAQQSQRQFIQADYEIDAGFVVVSYEGIPVIHSTGIPDTMVWNGSGARVTAFTGGATTALIVVNTEYIFYSELTPMTVAPLAKKSSQYDEIDLYADIVLVQDNTLGGAILGGIAP